MLDIISVFKGAVNPVPVCEASWQEALANFQSGKYRPSIDKVRKIRESQGEVAYREAKKKLLAVTFCANFSKNRDHKNVISATGFLIPDLDHLKNVDEVFNLLRQDEYVWFMFRSPSGSGLKCGVRTEGIKTDSDIKKLYAATENYFMSVYGLKLDPSCKDIARLTFVSSDPHLFINPAPKYFDVHKWLPVAPEPKFFNPPDFGQDGWKTKYGIKVLEGCCQKIQESPKGGQHSVRLKQARTVGGWIASGFIDEAAALACLENAVVCSGAEKLSDAMKTIRDGIEYGKKSPLKPEERVGYGKKDDIQYYCDIEEAFGCNSRPDVEHDDNDDIDDICNNRRHLTTLDDSMTTLDDSMTTLDDSQSPPPNQKNVYNLASEITKWIKESTGCFTCDQLDREFGLTSRKDKQNRSRILARMCARAKDQQKIKKKEKDNNARAINYIKKDKAVSGKFHIIDHSLEIMDILNTDVDPFQVELPFDLHRYCEIPKKGIIMIAGSSDSGKTTLILNILKSNLNKQFQVLYLASEMGPNETKKRLLKFNDIQLADWLSAKFIVRGLDQGSVIEAHNPDGLTLIDYLEEKEGEYFKITSQIREIYDAIGEGVAVIGIQKHTESEYGRGGQGTIEKARLSVSLDKIGLVGDDLVCAIKVIKIKNWVRKNLYYHELHFKIKHGAEIEPLTDWMPCSTVNRKICLAQYQTLATAINPEKKKEQMDDWTYQFRVVEGVIVGLTQKDLDAWKIAYPDIDVDDELEGIANWSYKDGTLKKKSWFMQVSAILAKRNNRKKVF